MIISVKYFHRNIQVEIFSDPDRSDVRRPGLLPAGPGADETQDGGQSPLGHPEVLGGLRPPHQDRRQGEQQQRGQDQSVQQHEHVQESQVQRVGQGRPQQQHLRPQVS